MQSTEMLATALEQLTTLVAPEEGHLAIPYDSELARSCRVGVALFRTALNMEPARTASDEALPEWMSKGHIEEVFRLMSYSRETAREIATWVALALERAYREGKGASMRAPA